jgi:AcrR family transcriptional regulator
VERRLAAVTGLRERLRAYVRNAFEHAERRPEVVRLILQVFFSSPLPSSVLDPKGLWEERFRRISAIIEDGIASGELGPRSPQMLARSLCGMMDLYIMARSHNADLRLSGELADDLVDLFLDGAATGPPAGRNVDNTTGVGVR